MECKKEVNAKNCSCSYEGCSKKGICCDCVTYHREKGGLPACFFPSEIEKTHDRSVERFCEIHK